MNHQVTVVGGQIAPVFWGIREKNPDVIHFLYTKESENRLPVLEKIFPEKKFWAYKIPPYDFVSVKMAVERIIEANPDAHFELNLTGGTKIMTLACQQVFSKYGYTSFYIDQNNRIFSINTGTYSEFNSKEKLDTFLKLTGHTKYAYKRIADFTKNEIDFAHKIDKLSGSKIFKNIIISLQKQNIDLEKCSSFKINSSSGNLNWANSHFQMESDFGKLEITSKKAMMIAFNGVWWELMVANAIRDWDRIYEMALSLEFYSKTADNLLKNEIDIAINTGRKLIFLECKSGNVKQEDLNKIRAVKRLYGGIASRSILISKYKPRPDIVEKCEDLGIDLFYGLNVKYLKQKLNGLLTKMEL